MESAGLLSPHRFRVAVLVLLVAAGAWRVAMAARMPVLSRDGVVFCWYARDLGDQGLGYLQRPEAQQHPLYPALILGTQRVMRLGGAADTPMTWQRAGQAVSLLAGLAVIALTGVLASTIVRRASLPLDARLAALLAMILVSILDLAVWLSADVMSDQVHAVFYLAAALLTLRLDRPWTAAACGLLAGLAFLTREEGFVVVIAGLAAVVAQRHTLPRRRLVGCALALLAGFLVIAGPYWAWVGQFSTKKAPQELIDAGQVAASPPGSWLLARTAAAMDANLVAPRSTTRNDAGEAMTPDFARLETHDPAWYALLPHALYRLLRAGRVLIPLLALPPLLNLRRRLLHHPLIGLTTCAAGHLALTLIVLERYGYLQPRHMLVLIVLLAPLAALLLTRIVTLLFELRKRAPAIVLLTVLLAPVAAYARRTPNHADAYLRDVADFVLGDRQHTGATRLISGSSGKRIAFYADLPWQAWNENPRDDGALREQVGNGGPGYYVVEVGPGFERAGNAELLDRLLADPEFAGASERRAALSIPLKNRESATVHVFAIGRTTAAE